MGNKAIFTAKVTVQSRGGQTATRGPHAARVDILCAPQGSYTYTDSKYFECMLK